MSIPVNSWEGRSHQGFHYYKKCFTQEVSWDSILSALSYSLMSPATAKFIDPLEKLEEFQIVRNNIIASKYIMYQNFEDMMRSVDIEPIRREVNSDVTSFYRLGVTDHIEQKILTDFYTRVNEVHNTLKAVVEKDSATLNIALGKTGFPYKKYDFKTGIVNLQGKDALRLFLINERLHLDFRITLDPGDYVIFPEDTFCGILGNNPWATWNCKIKEISDTL